MLGGRKALKTETPSPVRIWTAGRLCSSSYTEAPCSPCSGPPHQRPVRKARVTELCPWHPGSSLGLVQDQPRQDWPVQAEAPFPARRPGRHPLGISGMEGEAVARQRQLFVFQAGSVLAGYCESRMRSGASPKYSQVAVSGL